jgi:DNA anti-recombination protein RmuC
MADTEVESILREIRERVLSQQRAGQDVAAGSARPIMTNGGNGAGDSATGGMLGTATAENRALINSYLTTTARTWDRLPPVVSNRSGLAARLELWLKRRLRSATRWFTWEQVNFNAAVHHALRDMLPLLSAYEQELGKLHARTEAEAEARRSDLEEHQTRITTLRVELRDVIEAQRAELNARVAELVSELRERDELLREEQRVCFKQLALETSEAAVLEDRARRKAEALLIELQQRIEQLEKR